MNAVKKKRVANKQIVRYTNETQHQVKPNVARERTMCSGASKRGVSCEGSCERMEVNIFRNTTPPSRLSEAIICWSVGGRVQSKRSLHSCAICVLFLCVIKVVFKWSYKLLRVVSNCTCSLMNCVLLNEKKKRNELSNITQIRRIIRRCL